MSLVVKNVPESLNISGEIKFLDLLKVLYKNNFLNIDFKEVKDKYISQKMINSIRDMEEEIEKNWLKNFTSLSS